MSDEKQVVIITGGAAGIGRGIAESFAAEQAHIVIADYNEKDGLATRDFLQHMGIEALYVNVNVALEQDVLKVVEQTLEKWGRIDVLVNNVGTHLYKPMLDIREEEWDQLMSVDLKGCFLMSKHVLPSMIERKKGSIIHISSVHANMSDRNFTVYSAAKGGVVSLTRSMAAEYASYGIRVNAVLPGWTRNKSTDEQLSGCSETEKQQLLESWGEKIPIGRIAEPKEIGHAVVFLASDKATYILGSCLTVDGGLTSKIQLN
ncbi:SDR family NAD(P)-dependent oxidoreductase [Paenibacillus eucommiae]|uniref:Dihydroanticapsin dehydrogenase n=1 Tax=Paenibacillus eucommiae TaxID=1355755 RepID=A0ABS4J3N4_9BACL|nr:SDR family oxidoreductase [Paenibacillus eucommiae]MBP1994428.1 dihydroanticapsin dehydrogenase [Paenibacillus eucommiae]